MVPPADEQFGPADYQLVWQESFHHYLVLECIWVQLTLTNRNKARQPPPRTAADLNEDHHEKPELNPLEFKCGNKRVTCIRNQVTDAIYVMCNTFILC